MINIPSYVLPIFKIPMEVSKSLEKIFSNFMRKVNEENGGNHLVRAKVTFPWHLWGLGVVNLISKHFSTPNKVVVEI